MRGRIFGLNLSIPRELGYVLVWWSSVFPVKSELKHAIQTAAHESAKQFK